MLKIKFLGAVGTVTGSKFLLETENQKILIDCGLFQGIKQLRLKNWLGFPIDPKKIDAVILTHAHIDHTGYLPILVKKGFSGQVFSTFETESLCKLLLPDAAYLQEEEAKYFNEHHLSKHKKALPLFDFNDVQQALIQFAPQNFYQSFNVGEFLITFYPVSHLLGASFVEIKIKGRTIIFSGDVGRDNNPLLKAKEKIKEVDYLILESTYGDRLHPVEDSLEILEKIINTTFNRKGITLIPTFAVGRAQELLYYIYQLKKLGRIPDLPVYLNSPMACKATDLYQSYADNFKVSQDEVRNIFSNVHYVSDIFESKALNESTIPSIILSASGMMTGGRVLHHLKTMAPHQRNSIVIVGFQAAGTRGEALVRGKKELKIHGEYIPINAEVHCLQTLSAHADYQEIISWLKEIKKPPLKTFIVHGEVIASDEMRKHLEEELNFQTIVPEYLSEYDLISL